MQRAALLLPFLASLAFVPAAEAHLVHSECRTTAWYLDPQKPVQSAGSWQQAYWDQFSPTDPNSWFSGQASVPFPTDFMPCQSCIQDLAGCYPSPCFEESATCDGTHVGLPWCWDACTPEPVDNALDNAGARATGIMSNVWRCVADECPN